VELFEKDYRERFTIDEDEPHMSNVCGRYRAADGLARFCNGDTDKMYKITQKKMRYSFNNPFSDATRADAFVAKCEQSGLASESTDDASRSESLSPDFGRQREPQR
jgi:hypothetical protein